MEVPYNEDDFAVLVQARRILWDHTHRNHWKKPERQNQWKNVATYFAEEDVDGAFLEGEFKRIRKTRNQRKIRSKKSTKSGSAGGQQIENMAADKWAFLDEVGLNTANVSRISNISGDGQDQEHGEGEDGQRDLLQAALAAPRNSIAFRNDQVVGDCCAAINEANELLNEGRESRLPPPSPSGYEPARPLPSIPGEFVLSPHGRRMRAVRQEGGNGNDPPNDQAEPSTPTRRSPPARRRRPPNRYSPSDHESDGGSSSCSIHNSITSSARKRRRRAQVHQPFNLSTIEEDGDHPDSATRPIREEMMEQLADIEQSPPVRNPQVREQRPPRNPGRPHDVGGGGDGLHVGDGDNPPHGQHPAVTAARERRQQREGHNARADRVVTAGQRVQAAFEQRREAQRNVIRAQVEAQAVRRQRRGNNVEDQDDPRRMEEGPDMVLLRQFLSEKDMDAFGHFGQTVACQLRALPPHRSGEAMVDILQTLHTYSLVE